MNSNVLFFREYLTNLEITNAGTNSDNNISSQMDNTTFKIISLLVLGYDNKKISSALKIPLRYYSKKNQNNTTFWTCKSGLSTQF